MTPSIRYAAGARMPVASRRESRSRWAPGLLALVIGIAAATNAAAGPSTLAAPRVVYTGVNQTVDFTGTDAISNESRALVMDAAVAGTCNPTSGNDYSIATCGRVQVTLNDIHGGTLQLLGSTQVSTGLGTRYVTASGAIAENATDPIANGGAVYTINMNGTLDQLNGALADLQYIPAVDFEDGGSNVPNIGILVNDGSISATNANATIVLRVEGPNGGPTLAGPASSLVAAAGSLNAYPPSTSDPAVLSVIDPELCLRAPINRCGGAYDAAPAPPLPETDDAMLLVAWFAQPGCGRFDFRSLAGFTTLGGPTLPTVNAMLTAPGGLALQQAAADAILATLGAAGNVDLAPQAGGLTTVFAGIAGGIDVVRYALSQVTYEAPATDATCTLNLAFSDLGNNGMPQQWVPPDPGAVPPVPEHEIPVALADAIAVTFNVVDTHPDVTVAQIVPGAGGDPAGPNKPSGFLITFSEPVEGFDASDLGLSTSSAPGAALGTLVAVTPGLVYAIPVTATGAGVIRLSMAAGAACAVGKYSGSTCDSGFDSSAPVVTDAEITWDPTPPTATVILEAGQTDPTSATTIHFTLDVSDPVSTAPLAIEASEIGLSGTANPTTAVVTWPDPAQPQRFRVAVSGMSGPGTVAVRLLAGAFVDAALNANVATADAVVQFDNVKPTVAVTLDPGQASPTSDPSVKFRVTFSENVTGFDTAATDLALGGTALPVSASIAGGPAVYTVTVTGMSAAGTVTLSIPSAAARDAALLANDAAPAPATLQWNLPPDVTNPEVDAIGTPGGATSAVPIVFTLTTSEPVSGFDGNDVSFAGSTVGGNLVATVNPLPAGPASSFTIGVTGMTSSGIVMISIPAGAFFDGAGNPNNASGTVSVQWFAAATGATAIPAVGFAGLGALALLLAMFGSRAARRSRRH